MAYLPNEAAGETVESLITKQLERGNIPLACDGCDAVTGVSPSRALEVRDGPQTATGRCENCGGSFETADLD